MHVRKRDSNVEAAWILQEGSDLIQGAVSMYNLESETAIDGRDEGKQLYTAYDTTVHLQRTGTTWTRVHLS